MFGSIRLNLTVHKIIFIYLASKNSKPMSHYSEVLQFGELVQCHSGFFIILV